MTVSLKDVICRMAGPSAAPSKTLKPAWVSSTWAKGGMSKAHGDPDQAHQVGALGFLAWRGPQLPQWPGEREPAPASSADACVSVP